MRFLKGLKNDLAVLLVVLFYLAINLIFIYREIYFLNVLPFILGLIFLAFIRLDIILYIIVFCTPISIPLMEFNRSSAIDFSIPTEPMLFGVMIIVIFKAVKDGYVDKKIMTHPVTYAILFNLLWILITSLTSTLPLVSFKFLLARLWFLTTFYYLAIIVFRQKRNIYIYIWCFTIPFLIVILYTINRHMAFGIFDKEAAHFVMEPFFRDHTSYGAILAMILFGFVSVNIKRADNVLMRMLFGSITIILIIALLLSYTRAAWISVVLALGILAATLLRIKFRYIFVIGVIVIAYVVGQRTEIIHKMEKNKQDSSADISEHIQSMSNIATDESNLERLNRWNSAFRMFAEKPVFGWGPGTYMFKYAPFQKSSQKTPISTNFGDGGNAHSEYIGPLAESGVLGMLSILLIAVVSLITGFRVYHNTEDKTQKRVVMGVLLGLITYLIHGSLNNFLDTDKASALFWGYIAFIVSQDILIREKESEKLNS